ncbi:Hypothetical predicted protein, partial [Marmota monax]
MEGGFPCTAVESSKGVHAGDELVSVEVTPAAGQGRMRSTVKGYPKQRTVVPRNGFAPKPDLQAREAERQLVQRLKDRCERQARQLGLIQGELRRAICGFDALAVSTQHFFGK